MVTNSFTSLNKSHTPLSFTVEVVGFEIAAVVAAAVVAAVVAQCAAVIVVGAANELAALASFGASWAVVGSAPVVV